MNVTLDVIGWMLVLAPIVLFAYAYFGYPLLLRLVARLRPARPIPAATAVLPTISITIPCYNEEHSIADTLDRILAVDYPATHRQILIVSDASTDRTDEIVRSYADRGVELLRMPSRTGKTAAENAAAPLLRGDVVVNMDATIGLRPDSIQRLVRAFQDPTIGVASGRDVSVAASSLPPSRVMWGTRWDFVTWRPGSVLSWERAAASTPSAASWSSRSSRRR